VVCGTEYVVAATEVGDVEGVEHKVQIAGDVGVKVHLVNVDVGLLLVDQVVKVAAANGIKERKYFANVLGTLWAKDVAYHFSTNLLNLLGLLKLSE
jgi:hypothetical protein